MGIEKRSKGDKFRPTATILKLKGETPSVLEISGQRYILDTRAEQTRNRRKQYEGRTGHSATMKKRKGDTG